MSTEKVISDMAATAGAKLASDLGPKELTEFYVDRNGCAVVTTAGGETFTACKVSDIPPGFDTRGALTTEKLLRKLLPDLHRYGGTVPLCVKFYRSHRLVCGEPVLEFREAGR